jgi:hypothetical protein
MGDPDSGEVQVRNSDMHSFPFHEHHTNNNITEKTNNCPCSTLIASLVANALSQPSFT